MISVKCEYVNCQTKAGKKDYFIYTNIEVSGHADATDMHHTTGIKLCAGVSACCYGIRRLLDDFQFNVEIRKGYFHVYTEYSKNLRQVLDRESVYALNTLVCQLYELYCEYSKYFKTFDLIDIKEKIEDEKRTNEQWGGNEPPRKKHKVGFYSLIEDTYH